MLYLMVQDMEATTEKVKANGGSVVNAWSGIFFFSFLFPLLSLSFTMLFLLRLLALPPMPFGEHFSALIKDTEGNEWGVYHCIPNGKSCSEN
jgi:hypothetical protein